MLSASRAHSTSDAQRPRAAPLPAAALLKLPKNTQPLQKKTPPLVTTGIFYSWPVQIRLYVRHWPTLTPYFFSRAFAGSAALFPAIAAGPGTLRQPGPSHGTAAAAWECRERHGGADGREAERSRVAGGRPRGEGTNTAPGAVPASSASFRRAWSGSRRAAGSPRRRQRGRCAGRAPQGAAEGGSGCARPGAPGRGRWGGPRPVVRHSRNNL